MTFAIHPTATMTMRDVAYASGVGARRLWELRRYGLRLSADDVTRPAGIHARFAEADAVAVAVLEATIRAGNPPARAMRLAAHVLRLITGPYLDSRAADLAAMLANLRLIVPCTNTEIRLHDIASGVARRIETLNLIRQQSQ